jgi:hypothetical protein
LIHPPGDAASADSARAVIAEIQEACRKKRQSADRCALSS